MSSKKNKNLNVKSTLSKSDIDFYKMCGVFAIACIFIILTLKMSSTLLLRHASGQNLTYNFYTLCRNPLFLSVSAIVAAAGIIWFAVCRVKNISEKARLFSSYDALALVIYLAVFYASFGIELNSSRHMFFIAFTIISAVIFYISKIYKPDFVFYSVMNAFFALTVYMFADKVEPAITILKVVFIVAAVIICVLFSKKYSVRTKSAKKSKRSPLFVPVYISLVIWAPFMFWRMFTINSPLFLTVNAMLIVLLVLYIVSAIIYTVRLIRE